ncbi:MAG: hypothetical protein WCO73_03510 [Verrucomicrobiota bacterium]
MSWRFVLILIVSLTLGLHAEPAASKEDMAEIEALRLKVRAANPDQPVKAEPAATVNVSPTKPEDLSELDALKKKADLTNTAPGAQTNKSRKAQVIRAEEEGGGFELVLILDADVPSPAVIRANGHTLGEKIEVVGFFDGAAKFEGAYYPFIKSPEAKTDSAPVNLSAAQGAKTAADNLNDKDDGFGGFQISNILFAAFITVAGAIVFLKIKAYFDAKKTKGKRRRRA